MAVATHNGRRSLAALLRDLAEGSIALVRSEVRLARVETLDALEAIGRGAALIAFAAVLALLGALSLFAGIIVLIGDQWLPRDRYWIAALLVAALGAVLASWFAKQGLSLLASSRDVAPAERVPAEPDAP